MLLEEAEAQLTKSTTGASLLNYALFLGKLLDENKKQEAQLKEAERLIAIGQTAGMVGHDLRNPLQSIIGEVYMSKSALANLSESKEKRDLQESIEAISEQTFYMDKIVSDLQAFVKPINVCRQTFDLRQQVISILAQISVPDRVIANVQIEDGFSINADSQLLRRVLTNLMNNSIQAMPSGGTLTVSAQIDEGCVVIAVEDEGVGIADEVKSKLFMPLFTTKSKGQGFGLAVCKRVIEAHGGSIGFESREGEGAKFSVLLPLKKNKLHFGSN